MPVTRPSLLPDILDEHLDELAFLWARWHDALRDPEETLAGVGRLEDRIRAHLDGLLLGGPDAAPLLMDALESDDGPFLSAGAYALLQLEDDAGQDAVIDAFERAEPDLLPHLTRALAHAPLALPRLERIDGVAAEAPPHTRAAAAEVLVFHGGLRSPAARLAPLVEEEDPAVAAHGWRVVGLAAATLPAAAYAAAVRDEDTEVVRAALEAGAWCGEGGVLTVLRLLAREPGPEQLEALRLLAVIAPPDDLPLVERLVEDRGLGPGRFRIAGAYGHPALMDPILDALASDDPAAAAEAAAAFTKITGVDVTGDRTATVPPPDGSEPDDFEEEFLEEVPVPDPDRARSVWEDMRGRAGAATRLCRGFDTGSPMDSAAFETMDMETRRDVYLRSRFTGAWTGTAGQLEVFPQARRR